jgi:hypothetical protein
MNNYPQNDNNYQENDDELLQTRNRNEFAQLMMEDTIKSGQTEGIVQELLENTFGDHLMSIHHSRQASLANTQNLQGMGVLIEMGQNILPIPNELPENIQIDNQFLLNVQSPSVFSIYKCVVDFFAVDERHMNIKAGTPFVGLKIIDAAWVFGCPEYNPNTFGFVPLAFLEFQKEINKSVYHF